MVGRIHFLENMTSPPVKLLLNTGYHCNLKPCSATGDKDGGPSHSLPSQEFSRPHDFLQALPNALHHHTKGGSTYRGGATE